jgi:hypothetical protein
MHFKNKQEGKTKLLNFKPLQKNSKNIFSWRVGNAPHPQQHMAARPHKKLSTYCIGWNRVELIDKEETS